jgi:hypothetical protein
MHSGRMTHTTIEITNSQIACSLTAADYRRRVAETGDVAREALRERRPIDGGERLVFEETGHVRGRLEAFIAAESTCCPFLTMRLQSDGDRLALDITGPELATPIIEDLFA